MKPDPKEEHKKHTFDTYCKRILKNESSDYHRRLNVLMKHEIPLSELPQEILQQLAVILSILVYTFFSRMFDLMLPPVAKHSIVVA